MSRDNNRKAEINILGIFKVILIIVALGGAIVLFGYYFLDWDIAGFFDGFGGGGSSGGGSASVAGGGGEEGSGLTGSIMGILIVLIIIVAAFIWWRKSRAAKKEKKGDKWIKAEGSVYDIQRKRPLPNVTVNFVPKNKKSKGKWFRTTRKATTDQDGTFSVQLKNGVKYHIEVNGISGRQWSRRWKNPKTKRFEKATRYLTPRKGFGKIDEDFLKIHVGKVPRWTTIPVQDSTVPPTPLIPTPVTTTSDPSTPPIPIPPIEQEVGNCTLKGIITCEDRTAVPDTEVIITGQINGKEWKKKDTTDKLGEYEITGIPAGTYTGYFFLPKGYAHPNLENMREANIIISDGHVMPGDIRDIKKVPEPTGPVTKIEVRVKMPPELQANQEAIIKELKEISAQLLVKIPSKPELITAPVEGEVTEVEIEKQKVGEKVEVSLIAPGIEPVTETIEAKPGDKETLEVLIPIKPSSDTEEDEKKALRIIEKIKESSASVGAPSLPPFRDLFDRRDVFGRYIETEEEKPERVLVKTEDGRVVALMKYPDGRFRVMLPEEIKLLAHEYKKLLGNKEEEEEPKLLEYTEDKTQHPTLPDIEKVGIRDMFKRDVQEQIKKSDKEIRDTELAKKIRGSPSIPTVPNEVVINLLTSGENLVDSGIDAISDYSECKINKKEALNKLGEVMSQMSDNDPVKKIFVNAFNEIKDKTYYKVEGIVKKTSDKEALFAIIDLEKTSEIEHKKTWILICDEGKIAIRLEKGTYYMRVKTTKYDDYVKSFSVDNRIENNPFNISIPEKRKKPSENEAKIMKRLGYQGTSTPEITKLQEKIGKIKTKADKKKKISDQVKTVPFLSYLPGGIIPRGRALVMRTGKNKGKLVWYTCKKCRNRVKLPYNQKGHICNICGSTITTGMQESGYSSSDAISLSQRSETGEWEKAAKILRSGKWKGFAKRLIKVSYKKKATPEQLRNGLLRSGAPPKRVTAIYNSYKNALAKEKQKGAPLAGWEMGGEKLTSDEERQIRLETAIENLRVGDVIISNSKAERTILSVNGDILEISRKGASGKITEERLTKTYLLPRTGAMKEVLSAKEYENLQEVENMVYPTIKKQKEKTAKVTTKKKAEEIKRVVKRKIIKTKNKMRKVKKEGKITKKEANEIAENIKEWNDLIHGIKEHTPTKEDIDKAPKKEREEIKEAREIVKEIEGEAITTVGEMLKTLKLKRPEERFSPQEIINSMKQGKSRGEINDEMNYIINKRYPLKKKK